MSQLTAFRPMTYWLPSPKSSRQHRLAARALADLAGDLRRQPVIRRTPHQLQCRVHFVVGNQFEKRRLLKLNRKSLLQRVVEYAVAGLVVEIGEDNRVLISEFWRLVKIE